MGQPNPGTEVKSGSAATTVRPKIRALMLLPHSHAAISAANRRGIVSMICSVAFFIANDVLVKYVSQTLAAAQLIFIRGLLACVLLLAVAHAMGATRRPGDLLQRPVLVRSALDAVATMVYLTALFHLPIGNATAINLATPLFITLFAVLALGERVGAARWLAIGIGFSGGMADAAKARSRVKVTCPLPAVPA